MATESGAEQALMQHLQRRFGDVERVGTPLQPDGESTIEYLDNNREFLGMLIKELDTLISSYNSTTITDHNRELLQNTAALKADIPTLPQIAEIMGDVDPKDIRSEWIRLFVRATILMRRKFKEGARAVHEKPGESLEDIDADSRVYTFHYAEMHPRAQALAVAYHLLDELAKLQTNHPEVRKDAVGDALIEMLIAYHQESPLLALTREDPGTTEKSGLGWIDGYPGISDKLHAMLPQNPQ